MLIKLIIIVLGFLGLIVSFDVFNRIRRRHTPVPASPKRGPFFDSKIRKFLQPPELIINRSGLRKGMIAADIGCGSGAYLIDAARVVGPTGKIYGVDLQSEMLDQSERKLQRKEYKDIKNIELIKANASRLPFKNNSLDLVYFVNVLQETSDPVKTLTEAKRVLKPKGILAITEYIVDPDYRLKSTTIRMCEESGFTLKKVLGNFIHYTVKVVK